MAANTAGQQRPTSASGTSVRPGRQRRAERRGDTGVVGDLLGIPGDGDRGGVVVHRRQRVGASTPAAIASTARIAVDASSAVTTGMPPSTVRAAG